MKRILRGLLVMSALLCTAGAWANDDLQITDVNPAEGTYRWVNEATFSFVNNTGQDLVWDTSMSYVYLQREGENATVLPLDSVPVIDNAAKTITMNLSLKTPGTYTVYVPYYALYTDGQPSVSPDPVKNGDDIIIPQGLEEQANVGYCFKVTYNITGSFDPASGSAVEDLKQFFIYFDMFGYQDFSEDYGMMTALDDEDYWPEDWGDMPVASILVKENGQYVPYTGDVVISSIDFGDATEAAVTLSDCLPSGDYRFVFPEGYFFYSDEADENYYKYAEVTVPF